MRSYAWNYNPGGDFVMQYEIRYRDAADPLGLNGAPQWKSLSVDGGLNSAKIPNLYPGHTYVFQIRAKTGSGRPSYWSPEISSPIMLDTTPPPVPAGLIAYTATKGVWVSLAAGFGLDRRRP